MQDIKIRYTWRRKSDGHIWQEIVPIECLEGKGSRPAVLNDAWIYWKLVVRELWTGREDMNHKDVFAGDTVRIYWPSGYADEIISYDSKYGYFKYGNNPICELEDPHVDIEVIGNVHTKS